MSREAMQMALEALEQIHFGNLTPMAEEAWNKAIAALRQALETDEGNCYGDGTVYRGQRSKDSEVQTLWIRTRARSEK